MNRIVKSWVWLKNHFDATNCQGTYIASISDVERIIFPKPYTFEELEEKASDDFYVWDSSNNIPVNVYDTDRDDEYGEQYLSIETVYGLATIEFSRHTYYPILNQLLLGDET